MHKKLINRITVRYVPFGARGVGGGAATIVLVGVYGMKSVVLVVVYGMQYVAFICRFMVCRYR